MQAKKLHLIRINSNQRENNNLRESKMNMTGFSLSFSNFIFYFFLTNNLLKVDKEI